MQLSNTNTNTSNSDDFCPVVIYSVINKYLDSKSGTKSNTTILLDTKFYSIYLKFGQYQVIRT